MRFKMNTRIVFLAFLLIFGAFIIDNTEACSCMPSHPQQQYCQQDFVILARIRKEFRNNQTKVYKIRIRKEFKMSEKARVALKFGKIQTALQSSMCGVDFEQGKLYLISGSVLDLQAQVNLCGYNQLWYEVTNRQRKGFRLLYKKGCNCKVSYNHYSSARKDTCFYNNVCHEKYGICLKSPSGKCQWSKCLQLQKCIKGETMTPAVQYRREKLVEPLRERLDKARYQHFRTKRDIET